MKDAICYGGIYVPVGEKKSGYAPILDTGVSMPITVVNGQYDGPTVLITSGVHGGEYPCIETTLQIAAETNPAAVYGQLILIHPVNVSAFIQRFQYYVPEDGKNINRMFPGKANGSISEQIAYVLTTEYQKRADFYFDLHGGDIHEDLPFQVYYPGKPEVTDPELLRVCSELADRVEAVFKIKAPIPCTASASAAINCGVPALMLECGGKGLWSQEEVDRYKRSVYNLLYYTGLLKGTVQQFPKATELFGASTPMASSDGVWYPAVKLGEDVVKGQKIGEIRNLLGDLIEEFFSEADGIIVYIITSLAIAKGEPVLSIGLKQNRKEKKNV